MTQPVACVAAAEQESARVIDRADARTLQGFVARRVAECAPVIADE